MAGYKKVATTKTADKTIADDIMSAGARLRDIQHAIAAILDEDDANMRGEGFRDLYVDAKAERNFSSDAMAEYRDRRARAIQALERKFGVKLNVPTRAASIVAGAREVLEAKSLPGLRKIINDGVAKHGLDKAWQAPRTSDKDELISHINDLCNNFNLRVDGSGSIINP